MRERTRCIIIDAAAWRLELLAIMRDILDCEPVAAMDRIDRMLDVLDRAATRGGR
jgi:hypothetical protein